MIAFSWAVCEVISYSISKDSGESYLQQTIKKKMADQDRPVSMLFYPDS